MAHVHLALRDELVAVFREETPIEGPYFLLFVPRKTPRSQTSMERQRSEQAMERKLKRRRHRRERKGGVRRCTTWMWILCGWMVADARTKTEKHRPRAYACITGQLKRLELQGKIDNLFQPMFETYDIDIGMVLSTGTASFVVKRSQKVFAGGTSGTYATFQDVERELENKFGLVRIKEMEQPSKPTVNTEYVDHLDKGGTNQTLRVQRSVSHVHQWSSYLRCLEIMDELEDFLGLRYDVVLRMREDVHILLPIDMASIVHDLGDRKVLVQTCDSWGGINDKIALLGRESAVPYFMSPLERFYLHPHEMLRTNQPIQVKNPETFLRKSYEMEGLAVNFLDASKLLAIPIRRISPQETCYPLGIRSMKCLRKQLRLSGTGDLLEAKCTE